MKESRFLDRLERLSESLKRIKTQLAWLSLKQGEWRPGDRPVLCTHDELAVGLRNEQAFFISAATALHEALNSRASESLPEEKRTQWRRQLLGIESELRSLQLPKAL